MRRFCVPSLWVIAVATAGTANAQSTAGDASSAVAATSQPAAGAPAEAAPVETGGLEDIIVTATRRSENLQNVPVAISAISSSALTKAGVFETTDLNHAIPNLQVSSPYGQQQPNFSLRGIGVGSEYNANAASPVGVYVDEVYQAFRSSHGQQLYDLSQVEVVRGPQGTLYGRNTTGGAINFITRKPELHGANGYATIGYGNFDRKTAEGAVELTPVEGVLGIRIAGTYVDSDPYIHNAFNAKDPRFGAQFTQPTAILGGVPQFSTGRDPGGVKSWGVRGTVRFKPSDTLDISLKGYAAKTTGNQEVPIATGSSKTSDTIFRPTTLLNSFLPAFATHPVAGGGGATLADAFNAYPGAVSFSNNANGLGNRDVVTDSNGRALTRAEGAVLRVEARLADGVRLFSISGYDSGRYAQLSNTDCDSSFLRLCSIGYNSTFHAFNQDVRLNVDRGKFKLILGAYYGHDSITSNNTPDFFNALSLFNRAAGTTPDYFNPAGIFSNANPVTAQFSNLLNPGNNNGRPPMPTGVTATQHYRQIRDSVAVYGEGSYKLTPTLTATAGLRYTSDRNKFRDGLTTYYNDAGGAALYTVSNYVQNGQEAFYYILPLINEQGEVVNPASAGPAPTGLSRNGKSNRLSGRAILDWKPVDGFMLYGSYSRGYRAGTFNGLAYQRAQQVYFVPPETVNAYEAGFKTRVLDNRVQLNGALFYYDYTGQQGQVVDSTATANLVALDGTLKGLELEAQFAATDRLTFNASLGLLDSSYKHGKNCGALLNSDPRQQVGNCVKTGSGFADVGGNPFPFAAKQSLNLGADWIAFKTDSITVSLHGDAAYTGNFHYDSFGNYSKVPLFQLPTPLPDGNGGTITAVPLVGGKFTRGGGDFWNLNARLTVTHGNISIAGWIKNITNQTNYPYGIATENLFGNDYRIRNAPRTYGAEATIRF